MADSNAVTTFWKIEHTLGIGLIAAAGGVTALVPLLPQYAPACESLAGFLTGLGTMLLTYAPSASGKT